MSSCSKDGGSFRDPHGHVFFDKGELYRSINESYIPCYNELMTSGLYRALVGQGMLVPHQEIRNKAGLLLKPMIIPFISYPYEWCFSQLKQAALLTLSIQLEALRHGMILKDASAFNVQWLGTRPFFIDTLSFVKFEGRPWLAYGQFCRHFLIPLALMSYRGQELGSLFKSYLDGIPHALAVQFLPRYLPWRIWLNVFGPHFVAKWPWLIAKERVSRHSTVGIDVVKSSVAYLQQAVESLQFSSRTTVWTNYQATTSYTAQASDFKAKVVGEFIDRIKPIITWDFGANDSEFLSSAYARSGYLVTFEQDLSVVEKFFIKQTQRKNVGILPLCMDISNPSPCLGWRGRERMSLLERGPCDLLLALALIHHLVVAQGTPMVVVAEALSQFCRYLLIEYVGDLDLQVKKLLEIHRERASIYSQEIFELEFSKFFTIIEKVPIVGVDRCLYLMSIR
jgi:hypothetical protein